MASVARAAAASVTWDVLDAPGAHAWRRCYIAGNDPDVYYLLGTNGLIGYVGDGETIEIKSANISTTGTMQGLCGGG